MINSQQPCPVCGENKVILKDGFLYCIECGTRAADSQPILEFSQDVYVGSKATRKQKLKTTDNNFGKIWSSWHGYNMILAGLASELGLCSSKEYELKKTTLKLWGMFLKINQVAFYTKASKPTPPKLIHRFHKKDLEYLYNIKKPRKKQTVVDDQIDETMDRLQIFKAKNKKKQLILAKHYDKISSSQKSNIAASQTLADLKVSEEVKPSIVNFSKMSKRFFKKYMSTKEIEDHTENGYCGFDCKCLLKKQHNMHLYSRINYLSIFNLYVLLAIALRINNDDVHIGDMLRWCREGHLSFGRYDHFFPEDMIFKSSDPHFTVTPNAMSHERIRKVAGLFAKQFNLDKIKAPNMQPLIQRYLKELELPNDLLNFILKLININGNVPHFEPMKSSCMPNYEAIALSYIIIAMKMIFGLDGVTENKISIQTEEINKILQLNKIVKNLYNHGFVQSNAEVKDDSLKRLFVWKSWIKYIEYRKICVGQYHYPTKILLDPDDCDNPDLFLHHKKIMRRDDDAEYVVKNQTNTLIKTIMEDINYNYNDIEETFPVFSCSLNPMSSYIEHLLLWTNSNNEIFNISIIEEDFTSCSLSYFFNTKKLDNMLMEKNVCLQVVCLREVHTNIKPKSYFYRHIDNHISLKSNRDVKVVNCETSKWNDLQLSKKITNILYELDTDVVSKCDIKKKHVDEVKNKISVKKKSVQLNVCYDDYWIQHYTYFDKFMKQEFEEELDTSFSSSFAWLLRECANMVEMSTLELYKELCNIENNLFKK